MQAIIPQGDDDTVMQYALLDQELMKNPIKNDFSNQESCRLSKTFAGQPFQINEEPSSSFMFKTTYNRRFT